MARLTVAERLARHRQNDTDQANATSNVFLKTNLRPWMQSSTPRNAHLPSNQGPKNSSAPGVSLETESDGRLVDVIQEASTGLGNSDKLATTRLPNARRDDREVTETRNTVHEPTVASKSKGRPHGPSGINPTTVTRDDWSSSDEEGENHVTAATTTVPPAISHDDIPYSLPPTPLALEMQVSEGVDMEPQPIPADRQEDQSIPTDTTEAIMTGNPAEGADTTPTNVLVSHNHETVRVPDPPVENILLSSTSTSDAQPSNEPHLQQSLKPSPNHQQVTLLQGDAAPTTNVSLQTFQAQPALPTPPTMASDGSHLHQQGPILASSAPLPAPTPMSKLVVVEQIARASGPSTLDFARFIFIKNAVTSNDMEALLFHQLYMLSTYRSALLLKNLQFDRKHFVGFERLQYIFGDNNLLSPALANALKNFPDPLERLLQPDLRLYIDRIKNSLQAIGKQWPKAQRLHYARGFPLSPVELRIEFMLPSPELQRAVFISLVEELRAWPSSEHRQALQAQFTKIQTRHNGVDLEDGRELWGRAVLFICGSNMMPPQLQIPQYLPSSQQTSALSGAVPATYTYSNHEYAMPPQIRRPSTNNTQPVINPPVQNLPQSQAWHQPPGPTRRNVQPTPNKYQQKGVSHPLLPREGTKPMAIAVNPHTDRIALHQAPLWNPMAHIMDREGHPAPSLRLHQTVLRLVGRPQLISVGKRYAEIRFEVSETDFNNKLAYFPPQHSTLGQGHHTFREGSTRWRFRCVAHKTAEAIEDNQFCATATTWPEHLLVTINNQEIVELRRKQHYGKNLPAELTQFIQQGPNVLSISYDEATNEAPGKDFWIAVELVELIEHQKLRDSVERVSREAVLDRIMATLKPGDDEDIAITNPSISIDLTDPFSATIWETPVRSKHCLHRECFDLDTFFDTRPKTQPGGPYSANDWKCPICKKDARPATLLIDGFLESVRTELGAKAKLDVAKAILVNEKGEWEVKEDIEQQKRDRQSSVTASATGTGEERHHNSLRRAPSTPTVPMDAIMLDDDDD